MMDSPEVENSETLVDVRIYRIPKQDFDTWIQIVRAFGNNRQVAFRYLLDSYNVMVLFGKLHVMHEILEDRVKTLEQKWQKEGGNLGAERPMPKTFGGGL